MTTRRFRAPALLILGVLVAACGVSTSLATPPTTGATTVPVPTTAPAATNAAATIAPAGSTGAVANVCSLITEQEATAFLGADPGSGVSTNLGSGTATACSYGASLVVSVESGEGKVLFDAKQSVLTGQPTFHALSGLGDSAYATVVANTIADMEILKGSTLLSVLVQGNPSLQNITVEALQKLGATVIGRV